MKKERLHFSRVDKIGLLSRCMTIAEASQVADILEEFTFDMLKGLAQQIAMFAKGKEA